MKNKKSSNNLTGVLNVTDYISSDENDDVASELQSLLDNIIPGSELIFPERTYIIGKALLLDKYGVTLRGEGEAKFLFNNTSDEYGKYNGKRVGMINVYNDNITIDNLTLDQNFRNSGRVDGNRALIGCILIGGTYLNNKKTTNFITIKNCKIYDAYGDGISVFSAKSNDITIENNHVITSYVVGGWTSAGVKGEQCISVASGKNIMIRNNKIEGALDDAIAVHYNSENVTIENNTITTTGGRLFVAGITNGVVRNNKIEYIQNGSAGILVTFDLHTRKVSLNNNVKILDNEIFIREGVVFKQAIRLAGCGDNIEVRGNRIETITNQGFGIEIRKMEHRKTNQFYFGSNIRISDNEIINCKKGIQYVEKEPNKINTLHQKNLKSASNIIIENNEFKSCLIGLRTEKESVEIKNNIFMNCTIDNK